MTLAEIVNALDIQNDSDVVYAARIDGEWRAQSPANVVAVGENPSSELQGKDYFLEVWLIKEIIEVAQQWSCETGLSLARRVEAAIYYATHDAYIPVP